MSDRKIIANAKLDRIERDLDRMRRNPKDGPMLERFGYDHGNGLIYGTDGSCDLLFDNSKKLHSDAARLLMHCAPETIKELVHGYRLARMAGIIGDPAPDAEGIHGEETDEQLATEFAEATGYHPTYERTRKAIEWYRAKVHALTRKYDAATRS
jgi:hypothetical protein